MGKQKAPIRNIAAFVQKAHALRMPLDAQNRKAGVDKGFRHAVCRLLNDAQIFSYDSDALMMGAVNREAFSVEGTENASPVRLGKVNLVFSVIFVLSGSGKVLDNVSAEKNIDQLHALADAENGQSFLQKGSEEAKLNPVQHGLNGTGPLVFLMKKRGINIFSARKNQSAVMLCGGKAGMSVSTFSTQYFFRKRMAEGSERGKSGKIILRPGGKTGNKKNRFFQKAPL